MLYSLHIQHYALIESLDIHFDTGFSVITGETGAGKSIILGALGLLVGQRADAKVIRTGASRCVVEAEFHLKNYDMDVFFSENDLDFDGNECIVRREVLVSGKSRAFINDTPVSLAQMKELGKQLIDIHSQHQNLLLNDSGFQLNVLDVIAANDELLETYHAAFNAYKDAQRRLKDVIEEVKKAREDQDFLKFQLEQLDEANLKVGEQEDMEAEAQLLNHTEEIKQVYFGVDDLLTGDHAGILSHLKECANSLRSLGKVYPASGELSERIESTYIELKDISEEIENGLESIEFDPERKNFVNERLNTIYSLQQKHHLDSTEELIDLTASLRNRLDAIETSEEQIALLEKKKNECYEQVLRMASLLTERRLEAAVRVQTEMKARLEPLGIPNVRLSVDIKEQQPDITGADQVSFLFSANKNTPLLEVIQVASGGEIARVMLALKAMISKTVKLPTIVFDEIDTGVSGSIAEKMALTMSEMGKDGRQVISITHLPQIAACGEFHYRVYKEDCDLETRSHIIALTNDERIHEIAHMLSGSDLTEAAITNAKELLKQK